MQRSMYSLRRSMTGGVGQSTAIAAFAAAEYFWLNSYLDLPIISALLTLMTPLPLASMFSGQRRRRSVRP